MRKAIVSWAVFAALIAWAHWTFPGTLRVSGEVIKIHAQYEAATARANR